MKRRDSERRKLKKIGFKKRRLRERGSLSKMRSASENCLRLNLRMNGRSNSLSWSSGSLLRKSAWNVKRRLNVLGRRKSERRKRRLK